MAKDPRVTRIEDLPGPKSKGEMDEMKMPYEEYCKKIFDVGNEHTKPIALKGIRWLSCTMYIFTPHSVANLAELGAEVIKIVMPRMGDAMGVLKTTPLTSILPGITRYSVIQIAHSKKIKMLEERFTRDELYTAHEAFFTGTAAELTPIREVDDRVIGNGKPGPITKELQATFFDIVKGKNPEFKEWLDYL